MFNRFWRADPARARSTGGTGLGLAISLEDARLHGGWLEAWGEPGLGACFRLTLPKDRAQGFRESPLPLEIIEIPDDLREPAERRTPDEREAEPSSPAATFVINGGERRS